MLDLIVLAIVAVSTVLGVVRGLLTMVLGVVSWILAIVITWRMGERAVDVISGGTEPDVTQMLGGYLAVFFGVKVAVWLLGWGLKRVIDSIELTGTDRLLGGVLGGVRGVLLVTLLVLLAGFTSLTAQPAWQQSVAVPLLSPFADWLGRQLPQLLQSALVGDDLPDMGNSAESGDNGAINDIATGSGQP